MTPSLLVVGQIVFSDDEVYCNSVLQASSDERDRALEREALRVYRRYVVEIVERFGLCPWAERARIDRRTHERILLEDDPDRLEQSLEQIRNWGDDPSCEVGLLIYPRLMLDRFSFERYVGRLREKDASRHPAGAPAPFAMATFHPDAPPDTASGERLIPFLRRTPDPTIQLVRFELLEQLKARRPQGTEFLDLGKLNLMALESAQPELGLRERIAQQNLATVEGHGLSRFNALLDEIVRDRAESYARLGETILPLR